MPYRFDFDATNQIIRCQFEGVVTDELLKQYYQTATKLAAEIKPLSGIVDFSGVTAFDVDSDTILSLARSAPAIREPERPRVIVAGSPMVFGMARMYQTVGSESRPELHVVRTLGEAYEILGIREPRFDPLPTN